MASIDWGKTWETLIALLKDYWDPLAALALGVIWVAVWMARRMRLLDRFAAKRSKDDLARYFKGKLSNLRSWPSLLAASSIDFASEYVSLVLIEQGGGEHRARRTLSVDEILKSYQPIIVVSGPGCGKTTFLLYIYYKLLTLQCSSLRYEERAIPIFLRAADVAAKGIGLRAAIVSELSNTLTPADAEKLTSFGLEKKWFLIMVDGLDEIETHLTDLLFELRRFAVETGCHVLVTSRPISYDLATLTGNPQLSFLEVAIAPLSLEQKKSLVNAYARDQEQAEKVLRLIQDEPSFAAISRVTMNLLLLINSIESQEELATRSDFYRTAIGFLLSTLPAGKNMPLAYSYQTKLDLLSELSYEVLVNRRPFSRDTVARSSQPLSDAIFSEIRASSGLLRVAGPERFAFPHRTFAEYLAAVHVERHAGTLDERAWSRILSNESSEILGFMSSMADSADAILGRVLALPGSRAVLLSICLANCKRVDVSLQVKAEDVIWSFLLQSQDVEAQRSPARRILALIHEFPRPPEYTTIYSRLLEQLRAAGAQQAGAGHEEQRLQALRLLVHTTSTEIVPALIEIFRDSRSDTYLRFRAGELLARLSNEDLLHELDRAFQWNTDYDVRRFVLEAIVRTRSDAALPILRRAGNDRDAVVRDLAKEGISYIEGRRYLEGAPMVQISEREKTLKDIVPGNELSPDDVAKVAFDKDSVYRLDAFLSLRSNCPENIEPLLLRVALDDTENEFYRCEAVRLLGSSNGARYDEMLEQVFRSGTAEIGGRGAGARGCAVEYLTHRKHHDRALACILECEIGWRESSEVCKIVWSLFDIVQSSPSERIAVSTEAIRRICDGCDENENPRVQHWATRIRRELDTRHTAVVAS